MQKKRAFTTVLIAAAISVFAGCASVPTPEAMKAETVNFQLPKLPDSGKAMVYVVRPSSLAGLIRFNVFVGDQEAQSEMGYTRASQYIYFQVSPGEHKIYSKAENWAEAQVSAKAGDIIYIQQEPSMGVIMARNTIAKIEEFQGKYYVKTLTPGTMIKTEK